MCNCTQSKLSTNLDAVSTSTVAGTHVTVALSDSSRHSQVSVLTIHVVGARAGIRAKPDAKVLNLQWASVMDLGKQ